MTYQKDRDELGTASYGPEDDKLRFYAFSRLSKDDYDRAKAAGFRWAPKQELFYAIWTPQAEDLMLEWCAEIGDEDKSLAERAEERAERFDEYSDKRKAEADRAHAAVSAIADNIPLGQPILVGHHSEKHARRDAEKIENGMRRAVNAWKTSEYWQHRAAGALAHAKYKELPGVRARRIKTLEADLRQQIARYTPLVTKDRPKPQVCMQQKWSETYPHDRTLTREERDAVPQKPHVFCGPPGRGGFWVAVEDLPNIEAGSLRYREHLQMRIDYEKALLEEAGEAKLLDRRPKSAAAQLPLCNYRAPEGVDIPNSWNRGEMIHYAQVEMTQAEYAKIYQDYKGTHVVGNSHRVRAAVIRGSHVCVFISDSKVHVPPAPIEPKPREPRPVPTYTPKPVDPEAQKFEALQASLKAGVQVVSANQLFPTPERVCQDMVDVADIRPGQRILEPSAGTGNIISAIYCNGETNNITVTAVEINSKLAEALQRRFPGTTVDCTDFLELQMEGSPVYDRVLMNPPFENGADIKHIQHAITFLKPGGRLVAICANGPRQQDKLKPLADSWEELPAGTFEGTGVRAALMVYNRPMEKREEFSFNEPEKITAGRTWPSLKEGKVFDSEKLAASPLFDRRLF